MTQLIIDEMHRVLYLRAKGLANLGSLMQALHWYFYNSIKLDKKNPYGISFPEINDLDTGALVGIHFLHAPEDLLYFKPLMQLIVSNQASIENILELNLSDPHTYVAFIRDRRLEKGAPPRAMARMQKRITAQESQWLMQRYFSEHLPKICMQSSKSNKFTLHIGSRYSDKNAFLPDPEFNSYGLSSYQNPVFLPVPEEITSKTI